MTMALLWLQLGITAALILGAATFLARSADIIALKTGLGRSFVGVVLLATATSFPELGTGVSSIALFDEPDLAAGDAFGSNLFNLLIIGLLDLFWRDGPILTRVSTTSLVVAALGIGVIALAASAIIIHGQTSTTAGWYISPVSVVMVLFFVGALYMIYKFEPEEVEGGPEETEQYETESMARAVATYSVAAGVVIVSAIWLAHTGDDLAEEMGWDASFVGTQFLAFSTSLPELAASFAAIRIRAPELAITGVLGSNLFNMGFILFMDDVAYTDGALWAGISEVHTLTAVIAILMTAVVIVALVNRKRERPGRFWTLEAASLIGLYVAASVLVFSLS